MKLRSGNYKAINESLATMGASSRRIEYLPPEIWTMVGELIHGRTTLRNLVLVSHAFRDVFKPILHNFHRVELSESGLEKLGKEMLQPTLVYTKEIEARLPDFMSSRTAKEFKALLLKLLAKMPLIQSIRWIDDSCCYRANSQLLQLQEQFVAVLANRQRLIDLYVELSDHFCHNGDEYRVLSSAIFLKSFCNLSSLEIYNLSASNARVRTTIEQLAKILCQNPKLKKLGLATACMHDEDDWPSYLYVHDTDILEALCELYAQTGSGPLPLQVLRLGCGMLKDKDSSPISKECLPKMVILSTLKTLQLFNSVVQTERDAISWTDICWEKMDDLTSLQQLCVSRFENDACDWMNTHGQSVRELIITDTYDENDVRDSLEDLNAPNLTMLYTREQSTHRVNDADLDYEFFMESMWYTVLDRLADGGKNLQRLSLSMNLHKQWKRFSKHLVKLRSLTQLRIADHGGESAHLPMKCSSLWPGVEKPREIACHYAKLAKFLCPSLRYVRISEWAWELSTPAGLCLGKDMYRQITARQLERSEILGIELLAITMDYNAPGGLPGLPMRCPWKTEKYYERMAARSIIINDCRETGADVSMALRDAGLENIR